MKFKIFCLVILGVGSQLIATHPLDAVNLNQKVKVSLVVSPYSTASSSEYRHVEAIFGSLKSYVHCGALGNCFLVHHTKTGLHIWESKNNNNIIPAHAYDRFGISFFDNSLIYLDSLQLNDINSNAKQICLGEAQVPTIELWKQIGHFYQQSDHDWFLKRCLPTAATVFAAVVFANYLTIKRCDHKKQA